jgi:glycosyltransferase involved in cell wall biosynthesis
MNNHGSDRSRILLVNPFHSGSHRQWAEGLLRHSRHRIELLTLSGRHWKWRMHGAAVHFAKMIRSLDKPPEIVLTTDLLDLTTLRALSGHNRDEPKYFVYFHENQLSYPWSPTDPDPSLNRDFHYGFINYTSALAADKLFFNSRYHLESFLLGLNNMLRGFPDHVDLSTIDTIRNKSRVLYLGMDLDGLQRPVVARNDPEDKTPVLIWNHRWEYDKQPEMFFETLFKLTEARVDFRLIVTGESFSKYPAVFREAKKRLENRLLHFGYAKTRKEYLDLLGRADILPVTSNQDFFGGSVVEAIYAGILPLLPRRLAYPEHIPDHLQTDFLYDTTEELFPRLLEMIGNREGYREKSAELVAFAEKYHWKNIIRQYDEELVPER